jgi:hypothetical protein
LLTDRVANPKKKSYSQLGLGFPVRRRRISLISFLVDAEIQRHSELMLERQKSIEKRLRSIIFRQAMAKMETEQNLLLFLDGYYIKEQFRREIIEKG